MPKASLNLGRSEILSVDSPFWHDAGGSNQLEGVKHITRLSEKDKLGLAAFLESSVASLAYLHATLALISDDGLRKLTESAIRTNEAQVKGVQEFCQSRGIS